jgi:hypothetical protein
MKIVLSIKKITIIKGRGPDKVYLETDNCPCPYVKEAMPSQLPLVLEFDASANTAEQYVRDNFPQPLPLIEVISV